MKNDVKKYNFFFAAKYKIIFVNIKPKSARFFSLEPIIKGSD